MAWLTMLETMQIVCNKRQGTRKGIEGGDKEFIVC